jgi:3-hydroxyisobutyrate dehydrogenase-like beta-hydroxyacid dehydrogenase
MRIGWIGTGIMGYSMAGHLQQNGHELHVFNRTRQASRFRGSLLFTSSTLPPGHRDTALSARRHS